MYTDTYASTYSRFSAQYQLSGPKCDHSCSSQSVDWFQETMQNRPHSTAGIRTLRLIRVGFAVSDDFLMVASAVAMALAFLGLLFIFYRIRRSFRLYVF
jgi:hypothetical protein